VQTLTNTWVYLAQTPLLWLTITLIVYQLSALLHRRLNSTTILNPIITSIVVLVTLLLITGTPYETYFEGAQFVHYLLGPATVALAVPLYRYYKKLMQMFGPVSGALIIGSIIGIIYMLGGVVVDPPAPWVSDPSIGSVLMWTTVYAVGVLGVYFSSKAYQQYFFS